MLADFIANAGALLDLLFLGVCLSVLLLGVWISRNPVAFWDQFNPFLKPYSRFTLGLGRAIGFLWAFGAGCGCIVVVGGAVRAGIHHHWV